MSPPVLAVHRLRAGYGDFQALFDVDLELPERGLLGLVGANGAGKSTLFKAIMGQLPRERGMVSFRGQAVGHLPTEAMPRLGIALVPEGRRLFRSLSVEENLQLAAERGRRGDWTLDGILTLFPILGEKRKAPAQSLSGGQQQMVAIGRALIANPSVILFDEISLGLAPIVVNDVYAAMPAIRDSGIAAVMVEQDIERVRRMADHLICLNEGRVVLSGAPDTLTKAQITAAYFGD